MITGGCQCGAVRFVVDGGLGRASLCHCRMCQKAFGAFYGPLVSAPGLRWTRGEPKRFRSSVHARRGFCADCGTPLTFETDNGADVSIGALDQPERAPPTVQLWTEASLPWVGSLDDLPDVTPAQDGAEPLVSFQHPDHDTADWPPEPGA